MVVEVSSKLQSGWWGGLWVYFKIQEKAIREHQAELQAPSGSKVAKTRGMYGTAS